MTEPLSGQEYQRPRTAKAGPLRVRVPAKINLLLRVGGRRADGYHDLTTVYQAISVYDEITARPGDTLVLTMDGDGTGELPLDGSNLVIRAARALAEHAGRPAHARLHLRKHIPIAAGLAGGSADAAATLVACDMLWEAGLGRAELASVAATIGSDVPFLVLGGTALGTGRGEQVSPVLASPQLWHWVLAVTDEGLCTADVYEELDRLRVAGAAPPTVGSPDALLGALRQRNPHVLARVLGNDLQPAALSLRPALAETLAAGRSAGALAGIVSGSGPTCVFLAESAATADAVAAELSASGLCGNVMTASGPVPGARVL